MVVLKEKGSNIPCGVLYYGIKSRAAFYTGIKSRAGIYTSIKTRTGFYIGIKTRAVFHTLLFVLVGTSVITFHNFSRYSIVTFVFLTFQTIVIVCSAEFTFSCRLHPSAVVLAIFSSKLCECFDWCSPNVIKNLVYVPVQIPAWGFIIPPGILYLLCRFLYRYKNLRGILYLFFSKRLYEQNDLCLF